MSAENDSRAPTTEADNAATSEPTEAGNPRHGGILYLNLGKRDGVRAGEVARLLRESCELDRDDVGRIRIRDRYTFVDVPEDKLDAIIEKLAGQTLNDKALAPERARASRSS